MTFVKLPTVCQDYGLGYQSVNQLADNMDAVRELYAAKHGSIIPFVPVGIAGHGGPAGALNGAQAWEIYGRHNDLKIPRAVARVDVFIGLGGGSFVSGVFPTLQVASSLIQGYVRSGVGEYVIRISGNIPVAFGPVACQQSSSGPTRFARTRFALQGDTAAYTGIYISLFDLSAGDFIAADYGFSLPIYATG
jgi:hypothetical protein